MLCSWWLVVRFMCLKCILVLCCCSVVIGRLCLCWKVSDCFVLLMLCCMVCRILLCCLLLCVSVSL